MAGAEFPEQETAEDEKSHIEAVAVARAQSAYPSQLLLL
jgi:hypothetical protein